MHHNNEANRNTRDKIDLIRICTHNYYPYDLDDFIAIAITLVFNVTKNRIMCDKVKMKNVIRER